MKGCSALTGAAVQLAEHQAHKGTGLANHSGPNDGGTDHCDAAHHGLFAEDSNKPVACIDAVLEWDDSRVWPHQRPDGGACTLYIPQLDAKQDEIDLADAGWLAGSARGAKMDVPTWTEHFQTTCLDCREMGATREEGYLGSGLGQRRSKCAANPARTDNCDPHRILFRAGC